MVRVLLMIALLPALLLTGCAITGDGNVVRNDNVEIAEIPCPDDGGTYAFTYTSDMRLRGGGLAKFSGVCGGKCYMQETTNDADGSLVSARIVEVPCEAKIATAGINPDRIDANLGAVLGASTQLGTALIQKDAIEGAARIEAEAMKYGAEHSAPGLILINEGSNASAGGSTAVSQQSQGSQIGIDMEQSSGCASDNCFDPTK